ncbi:MAG: alpha/beta fold hydrolase, partial [Thermodesulfobacteriota bacterium]
MKNLIFLHGWGAQGNIWHRQMEAWGGRCRVLAPDIPAWEAEWLADYLANLPLKETVVVGWSLGGMLLLEALAGSRVSPAGLVLVGVPAAFCQKADYPWGQPPAVVRAMRRALKNDASRVLQEFALKCLAPGEEHYREEVFTFFRPGEADAYLASGLDYLLHRDLRPWLSWIPGPAVIIQGEQDNIVPPAQAHYLKQHLPGARLFLLPGAGHLPCLTQAGAFNEIVEEEFLRGGPGDRRS